MDDTHGIFLYNSKITLQNIGILKFFNDLDLYDLADFALIGFIKFVPEIEKKRKS